MRIFIVYAILARNSAEAIPTTVRPLYSSLSTSSNGSEDNANNRYNLGTSGSTREFLNCVAVDPVNFPVKVNRNCLCAPDEKINDPCPKNFRAHTIDGNGVPVRTNRLYTRNVAFDRNLRKPCEKVNVPHGDSSISELCRIPPVSNGRDSCEDQADGGVIRQNCKDEICGSDEHYTNCSKNVATSPIHHLSAAFHALNLSVASNTKTPIVEDLEPAPTPPPRPKRKKSDAEEKLDERQIEEFNYSVSSTDELSANVDKILDEIVNLELECLSMELYASLHQQQQQQQQNEQKMDHLRDGGSERENSKIKSFSSTRAERDRMDCGDEVPASPRRVADLEEGRVTPNSVFGKPPLPPTARNTSGKCVKIKLYFPGT